MTTTLPEALRPWREWLSWFDPELALQLGPLLQRLQPLLGPFRGHSQGGEPEIEGLDDLRTRGAYERLLASEWLLADEVPDEFLRRAANGEHMFLAPRPRARRADRNIVALFDAGPLQLGAPRLAHLALWILLARRAGQVQGEFRWGLLQAPGELFKSAAVDDLKALLLARRFELPEATSVAAWRTLLDAQSFGGERWLIGAPFERAEWQSAPRHTHRVELQHDVLATALEVSFVERGAERTVQLPLPDASSAAWLLRGNFINTASAGLHTSDTDALALQRPPIISFDSSRVAVALRDSPAARVFVVPRNAQAQIGKPRTQRWAAGYSALAVSFIGKQMGVLLSDANELRFWGAPLTLRPAPTQEEFHAPGSTAAWLQLAWLRHRKAQRVCVIDQSRRLLQWDYVFEAQSEVPASPYTVVKDVLGLAQHDKMTVNFAYHHDGWAKFAQIGATGRPTAGRPLCHAPADAAVLFGRGGVCAVRTNKEPTETWIVGNGQRAQLAAQFELPGGSRAIGLIHEPGGRLGLVTISRETLRLHFVEGGNELLYTAPARIVSCTVSPNSGLIAMLTEERQLVVFAAPTRELRLSVQSARHSHVGA